MVHAQTDAETAAANLCPVCRSTVIETVIRRIDVVDDQPYTICQVRKDCPACHWVDVEERHEQWGAT
jgi:hypothetical protein